MIFKDQASKILVTGAAGFIGIHLSKKLLEMGHTVLGLDTLNDYYDVNLKNARLYQLCSVENFEFQKLDIADSESLHQVFTDFQPN